MLILATRSQTSHSCFPLFHDHLEIANCSIVFYPLGNFGQALCIRSCHEDLILTRKSHNCVGIAFIQGDSAGVLKLIEQTLIQKYLLHLTGLTAFKQTSNPPSKALHDIVIQRL